ncbi:hypothetical protein JHK82_031776 [Glycine max]|nr:hypothetical protein JHK85_032433 [Glycine max]KAG4995039.1 hypothetical protein JHK86_031866 [Glycine max]KAG5125039.1 hypothetical protein JHK82_031776 [Glycine max]KAG5146464.1 hypothetical protein JHK84_032007 [Glycine max]
MREVEEKHCQTLEIMKQELKQALKIELSHIASYQSTPIEAPEIQRVAALHLTEVVMGPNKTPPKSIGDPGRFPSVATDDLLGELVKIFQPLPISAISGTGTAELIDLVYCRLQKIEESNNLVEEDYVLAISIVGRPNVAKSTILNALVGEDRTIGSPISGTTRDAIDTEFTGPDGQKFQLIDTAGIKKITTIASAGITTEALSVNRAFRAICRFDVVVLVIEAMACITK